MSRRQYVTQSDAEQFSNIQVTDATEADDQISHAEEMVDSYVGFQKKHISDTYSGLATSAGSDYLVDNSGDSPLKSYDDDYYTFCEIEILGGTGEGQTRTITAYDSDTYKVTVGTDWSVTPDSTSFYVIRQVGKFPREEDVFQDSNLKYYKSIPEAVQRATLAQLEYIIEKGDDFFAGATDYESEDIEGYSHTIRDGANRSISPLARELLKGIRNKKGRLRV